MEDLRIEANEETLQRVDTGHVLALFGRAGSSQRRSRGTRCASATPVGREHHSAQLLDVGAQQIGGFLRALDPRELPPALRTGTGFHGAGTAQVINAGQHQPDDLLVGLGDAEYPERGDDTVELYHRPLLVLVFLQRCHEWIVLGD